MAKKKIDKRFHTMAEAAKILRVSRAAIHRAIAEKRLKAKKGIFTVERIVKTKMSGWIIDGRDLKDYQVSTQHQDAGKKND